MTTNKKWTFLEFLLIQVLEFRERKIKSSTTCVKGKKLVLSSKKTVNYKDFFHFVRFWKKIVGISFLAFFFKFKAHFGIELKIVAVRGHVLKTNGGGTCFAQLLFCSRTGSAWLVAVRQSADEKRSEDFPLNARTGLNMSAKRKATAIMQHHKVSSPSNLNALWFFLHSSWHTHFALHFYSTNSPIIPPSLCYPSPPLSHLIPFY